MGRKSVALSVCLVLIFSVAAYSQVDSEAYILKGESAKDALETSIAQWSGDIFDFSVKIPIVVVAVAGENITEANPAAPDVTQKQRFFIEEKVLGDIEAECVFTYKVFPSTGERKIYPDEKIIGILKKYKVAGQYELLTAASYSQENRERIAQYAVKKYVEKNPISKEQAVAIADQVGQEEVERFNSSELADSMGGPFKFQYYKRTSQEIIVKKQKMYNVFYQYEPPSEEVTAIGLGHPRHFSVWVEQLTGEPELIYGQ
ncbi:hypothetical protein ACFL38_03945 [Candidatus Omnitrophota bacterium]